MNTKIEPARSSTQMRRYTPHNQSINLQSYHDSAIDLAAEVGRDTADFAALLFALPLPPYMQATFEAEIHDEVAALFEDDPTLDACECEQAQAVAWLAFDRRLALHARNQLRGGRA